MSGQNWGSWASWTPSISASTSGPSLGTGATQRGGWIQTGTIVHWWSQIAVGTSPSAGSGYFQLSLPVAPITRTVPVGNGFAIDVSESAKVYPVTVLLNVEFASYLESDPQEPFMVSSEAADTWDAVAFQNSVPFTIAAGDILNLAGCYEAATS